MSTPDRRLSAIMFTDIVGYSAITQSNEETALRLLQEHRNILRPIFAKYSGNEIKTIGDAFLVEFQSALLAVKCAIEIQRELKTRNSFLDPKEHIWLRIGLHIGDVVFQHNDVYGDGVNIASRIHAQAPPGGICISRAVYEQIANKIDEKVIKQRAQKLKSIEKPVQLFLIELDKKPRTIKINRYVAVAIGAVSVLLVLVYILFNYVPSYSPPETSGESTQVTQTPQPASKPAPKDSISIPEKTQNTLVNNVTETPGSSSPAQENKPIPSTNNVWNVLQKTYQPITESSNWYDLQRKLTRYRDAGLFGVYSSETTVPDKNGSLVAILDSNATANSTVEAYLIYTSSGFVNVSSNEKITSLKSRYPGRRQIWIRSLK